MAFPEFCYSFRSLPKRLHDVGERSNTFDDELEALIEKAGRDKVFAVAKAEGWEGMNPPKWVWAHIAASILAGRISVKERE